MADNEQIHEARRLVADGRNVLITGRAGTGKSTLLARILDEDDVPAVVLAPTGVAALNVGGQTIHRFFSFPSSVTPEQVVDEDIVPRRNLELIGKLRRLIIDEVSMVRADLMDCVDAALRRWGPHRGEPFGGVQMVFVGDPYQLPPVVTDSEVAHFADRYQTPFFFSSDALAALDYEVVELVEVFRQSDPAFVEVLNAVRDNTATDDHFALLNTRVDPDFVPPADSVFITLTTTRRLADSVNDDRLAALAGEEFVSDAVVAGDFPVRPTKADLRFKVGAQVMMLTNDGDDRWVNGSLGLVRDVRLGDSPSVSVLIVDTGEVVDVEPFTWRISQPRLEGGRLGYEPVGTFRQFPFDLAWAVTIHKGQGKTFDRVVIDLGRGTFAEGQLYVALSRCRSLEGLVLRQQVDRRHVLANPEVGRYLGRHRLEERPLGSFSVAAVAVNATGFGAFDRVVELSVVISENGVIIEEFDSIVHPMRDLTGSGDHGVTAAMASMAPAFGEVWAAIAPSLEGCVLAADGRAPLLRLLQGELARATGTSADFGLGLCVREFFGPALAAAYAAHGFAPDGAGRALDRARAITGLLGAEPERAVPCTVIGDVAVGWEMPRLQRRTGFEDQLVRSGVLVPADEPEAPYARMLALLLDDGRLGEEERAILGEVAVQLGLTEDGCARVHEAFCESMVVAANRDAEITDPEWDYLVLVHEDLGVEAPPRPAAPASAEVRLTRGMKVCLTGLRESDAQVGEREVERRLREHGLIPVGSVGTTCHLLVAAERSSMSKKASRARQFGVPIIEVQEFLSLLESGEIGAVPPPAPGSTRARRSGSTGSARSKRPATLVHSSASVDVHDIPKGRSIDKYSRRTLRAVVAHVDPDRSLSDLALLNAVFNFLEFSHRSARRLEAVGHAIDAERGDPPGSFSERLADQAAEAVAAVNTSGNALEVARALAGGESAGALQLAEGMKICFTGQAMVDGKRVQRKVLEEAACHAGLVPTEAVSGLTDVLVCPDGHDKAQSKYAKAIKLGVHLMSVSEFVAQVPVDAG
jgi:hypothetical protein